MTVGSKPHYSVFVSVAVDHLFLHAASLVSWTDVLALLSVNCISTENASFFLCIKLLHCSFLLLLNACLVLSLQFPDLRIMFFFKCLIFLHDTVHIALVYINNYHFLPLFQCFIFVL